MNITKICFDGYKNLNKCEFEPIKKINLIYGKNAQGKTNLLEAINLFSNRFFKSKKNLNLINFEKQFATLEIEFLCDDELNRAKIVLGNRNKFILNGINFKNLNEFYGNFHSIFFSPTSLLIVKGSPNYRRKFLNSAILQLKPVFLSYSREYNHILEQRNKILKNKNRFDENLLEIFTQQLAKLGTIISIYRADYISKISSLVSKIYKKISNNAEMLEIFYKSTIFNENIDNVYNKNKIKIYFKKLEDSINFDRKLGFTNFGAHKDDIIFKIDGLNLKDYGSQGQKKTCVLALKLAQAKLNFLISNKRPIFLLDEVLSELDELRQEYLINSLKNNQVFISCCSLNEKIILKNRKIFQMNEGKIEDFNSID